jgi:hypothetical protein
MKILTLRLKAASLGMNPQVVQNGAKNDRMEILIPEVESGNLSYSQGWSAKLRWELN